MDIHEYQAKELLKTYGIGVPNGIAVLDKANIEYAVDKMFDAGHKIVVVKAQIHAGGRGKGGGVKLARSKNEAIEAANKMFGMTLVTHQTGPAGKKVNRLYFEEGSNIKHEYYFSIVLDRKDGVLSFIASSEGGMDIEEVATHSPDKIVKVSIDPATGVQDFHIRRIGYGIGLSGAQIVQFGHLVKKLYTVCKEKDVVQLEINPLVETEDSKFIPLDAKFNFDDNALFRHIDIAELRDEAEEEPLEIEASKAGLSYVKMDGQIGCMVNGAGLAMATMDIIKLYGKEPANFLDVGGSATEDRVTKAFQIILEDVNVKGVLINIFGGIMKCDIIAKGLITAAQKLNLTIPVVVRLEGTNAAQGKEILANSGLDLIPADDLADAAKKIVLAIT